MGRYKRYLYSHVPIPNRTAYRQGARQRLYRKTRRDGNALHEVEVSTPNDPQSSCAVRPEEEASHISVDRCTDFLLQSTTTQEFHENNQVLSPAASMSDSSDTDDSTTLEDLQADSTSNDNTTGQMFGGDHETEELNRNGTIDRENKQPGTSLAEHLCECTKISVGDVMLMCLTLGLRHNLSWLAQIDILKMVDTIFGRGKIPTSKYHFLKQMERGKENMHYHIYCPVCEKYHGKKDDLSDDVNCTCGEQISVSEVPTYFLSVSLEGQLRDLLKNPDVCSSLLTYRFNREKTRDRLEDIYDGAVYQKHFCNNGILSSPYNFSYCFNTDGAPMGKSSDKTIWPIYIMLNELPPKDRSRHMLLAGLYVGTKDPNQKIFLQPFVEEANVLSDTGFSWVHDGKTVNSKVIPLCAIVDSVARWQMLNMSSFNAHYGCTFCYIKTERTLKGQRFAASAEIIPKRTAESTVKDMQKAYARRDEKRVKDRIVKGVKGPSPLITLAYFNLISGFVADYMHAVLLGVIRLHTELIFEPARKTKIWKDMDDNIGMEHLIAMLDKTLINIKPPKSITRLPRRLKDMAKWKASEWRAWLVFYSVPCIQDYIKEKHLRHIACLSKAAYILLQKSVSVEEVHLAHEILLRYVFCFQKYFDVSSMVYNVHLLTHICEGVLNYGPLWTHNCFPFEGYNRHLLQLHQSPSHVAIQITRKFLTYSALPTLCSQVAKSESSIKFCEDILDQKLSHFIRCNNIVLLGKGHPPNLSEAERLLFSNLEPHSQWLSFSKMLFNGVRYAVDTYADKKKR